MAALVARRPSRSPRVAGIQTTGTNATSARTSNLLSGLPCSLTPRSHMSMTSTFRRQNARPPGSVPHRPLAYLRKRNQVRSRHRGSPTKGVPRRGLGETRSGPRRDGQSADGGYTGAKSEVEQIRAVLRTKSARQCSWQDAARILMAFFGTGPNAEIGFKLFMQWTEECRPKSDTDWTDPGRTWMEAEDGQRTHGGDAALQTLSDTIKQLNVFLDPHIIWPVLRADDKATPLATSQENIRHFLGHLAIIVWLVAKLDQVFKLAVARRGSSVGTRSEPSPRTNRLHKPVQTLSASFPGSRTATTRANPN